MQRVAVLGAVVSGLMLLGIALSRTSAPRLETPMPLQPTPVAAARPPAAPTPDVPSKTPPARATADEAPPEADAPDAGEELADRTLRVMQLHQALLEVRSTTFDPDQTPREQDQTLAATLQEKTTRYQAVVKELTALLPLVSEHERLDLLMLLGEADADMGDFIEGNPVPSYLTGEQGEVYERLIQEKAARKFEDAEETYLEALELSEEGSPERRAIEAELERLEP